MPRIRLVLLLAPLALLAAHLVDKPVMGPMNTGLEGSWVVRSVARDGHADATQVGAILTFADDRVTFVPTVGQFSDFQF
jgi:hypothetical protein